MRNYRFALVASLSLLSLGSFAHAQEPWKLSAVLPLTGERASSADELKVGFEIALDEINRNGGIAGRPLELQMFDTQSNPGQVATVIRQACQDSFAVVGPAYSADARVAFPVANSMDCPAITPGSSASGLTGSERPWTFSYYSPAAVWTPTAIKTLIGIIKPKKAAVVLEKSDPASLEQGTLATKTLEDSKVQVDQVTVPSTDVNFGPAVTRIDELAPDLIVIASYDKVAVGVIKELRKAQNKANIIVTSSAYNGTFIKLDASLINGIYRFSESDPLTFGNPRSADFIKAYQEKTGGRSPATNGFLTYDALKLVAEVISKAGLEGSPDSLAKDRQKFVNALATVKDWTGLAGKGSMTPDRYMYKGAVVLQCRDGKWVRVN